MPKLITKPRKLLEVEAHLHWSHGDNPHNNLEKLYDEFLIQTDKGLYQIRSCANCSGMFWIKLSNNGKKE